MEKNQIFLSYRRDDSPGYVSRLESELGQLFGDGRVFRDASDIPGGTQWKNVIDAHLHSSAVLLLIIGPRWEQIWFERNDDDVNYVALELLRARELGVPIIPVTLDGTQLSNGTNLGDIKFILDNQFFDLSDKQGRWNNDFNRLVGLLENVPGIGTAGDVVESTQTPASTASKSNLKWLAFVGALLVIVATLFWKGSGGGEPISTTKGPTPVDPTIAALVEPGDASSTGKGLQQNPEAVLKSQPDTVSQSAVAAPDINGIWQARDGTVYAIKQHDDGSFDVESPQLGTGQGQFLAKMPGKFEINMPAVGRGEFAVSNSHERGKAMGWFVVDGQQKFDTLIRIE